MSECRLKFPLRTIHLDFHTGPWVPDVGRDFDPDRFARTFKEAPVDGVTVFAKCLFVLAVLQTSLLLAGNRVTIQGRDVLLAGRPYLPHGMVQMNKDHLPTLRKLGLNTVCIDLPFRDYDPQQSDAENRKRHQGVLEFADAAHAQGMTMLWLFSFHYTPEWLWQRYPDVHLKQYDGTDGQAEWISMCLDHPGFRADAEKWLTFLAKLLGPHPATLGYILWNEPFLAPDIDYNPYTLAAFHRWLRDRYKTPQALNQVWGTSYAAFGDVKAPPPRVRAADAQTDDQMAAGKDPVPAATRPATPVNSALWMDWMRFRQDDFAAWWRWEAAVVRKGDPGKIITSKIIPFDLYGSHAAGAGVDTERWVNGGLDVLGMDLYSRPDDDFLDRWKCDYFYSLAAGKPIWHTEMNLIFSDRRGIVTPEQWRTYVYHQLARGVNGFWNFMWGDNPRWPLHYTNYKFAPMTYEIGRLSVQMNTLAPLLHGMRPADAQVAVLHSTTTNLALAGDQAPTADQSAIIELLYRGQTPFRFITEDMIRHGDLKKYRALVAVGAVALPEDVLAAIRKFTGINGGHVLANAQFAAVDDYGRSRRDPADWMGVKVGAFHRMPRQKTGTLAFSREARTVADEPMTAHVSLRTWSARPITLADGSVTGAGTIYGNEDTQVGRFSNGRHELYWEDIQVLPGGKAVGTFADGRPAIAETPQTLYVARDTCWLDARFARLFRSFLDRAGVQNTDEAVLKGTATPAPSVDVRRWEGQDRELLFVINSVRTLSYDGTPIDVEVLFNACGEVTDALTGKPVPSRRQDFRHVVPLTLKAGDVRVLMGRPYAPGPQTRQR